MDPEQLKINRLNEAAESFRQLRAWSACDDFLRRHIAHQKYDNVKSIAEDIEPWERIALGSCEKAL
jgi:hypothetical protein